MAEASHPFAFGQNLSWILHDKEASLPSVGRTPKFDTSFFPKASPKSVVKDLPYPQALRASSQGNRDSGLLSEHLVKIRKDFITEHASYGMWPETCQSIAEPPINDFILSLAQVAAQQIRQVYKDGPSSLYPNRLDCNNNLQEAFAGRGSSKAQNGASGTWTALINSAGYSISEDARAHGAEQGSCLRTDTSPVRLTEFGIEAQRNCARVESQSKINIDAEVDVAPKLINVVNEKLIVSASAETDVTEKEHQAATTLLFMNRNHKPINHTEAVVDPVSSAFEFSSGQSRAERCASGGLLPLTYSASAPTLSPLWQVDSEDLNKSSSREILYPAKAPVSFTHATLLEERYGSSVLNADYGGQGIENFGQSQGLPTYHQYIYTHANGLTGVPAAADNVVDAKASSSIFYRGPPWQCASDFHNLHVSEKMAALNGEKSVRIASLSSALAMEQSSDLRLASGRRHSKSGSDKRPEYDEPEVSFTGSLSKGASQVRDPVTFEKHFPHFPPTCYAPLQATQSSYGMPDLPLLERGEIRCGNEYTRQPDSSGWPMDPLSSWGYDHAIPCPASSAIDPYSGFSSYAMGPFSFQLHSTAASRQEQHPTPYPVLSVDDNAAPRLNCGLPQFSSVPMNYPSFPYAPASALRPIDWRPLATGADSRFGSTIFTPACNVASGSDTPGSSLFQPSSVARRSLETAEVGVMKDVSRDGSREDASEHARKVHVTLSSNLAQGVNPAASLDLQASSYRDRMLLSSTSCASSSLDDHQRHGVSVDNQLSASSVCPELRVPSPPVMPVHAALRYKDSNPSVIANQVSHQSGGSCSTFSGAREASSLGPSSLLRPNAAETRDILDDFLRMPDILDEFLRMPTKSYVGLLSESSDFNALFCPQAVPPSAGPPAVFGPDLTLDTGTATEVKEATTEDAGSCCELEANSLSVETNRDSFLASSDPLPVQSQVTSPSPFCSIPKANTEDDAPVPVTFVGDDAVQGIKLREEASSDYGSTVGGSKFQIRRERVPMVKKSSVPQTNVVEDDDVEIGGHSSAPKVFFGKRPQCTECAILDGQQACIHLERLRIMVPNLNNRHTMQLRRRSVAAVEGVSDDLISAGDLSGSISRDARGSDPLRCLPDFSLDDVGDACSVARWERSNVRTGASFASVSPRTGGIVGRSSRGLTSGSRNLVEHGGEMERPGVCDRGSVSEFPTKSTAMHVEATTDAKLASESATSTGPGKKPTSFSSEDAPRIRQELAAGRSHARHAASTKEIGQSRLGTSPRPPSPVVEHAGGQPKFPCVVTVSDGRCYYLISKSNMMSQSLLTQTLSQAIEIPKKDGTGVIRLRPVATVSGEALAPLLNWKTPSVVVGEKSEPSTGVKTSSLKRSEQSDVVPGRGNPAGLMRKRRGRYSALDLSPTMEDELEDLVAWQEQQKGGVEVLPEQRSAGLPLPSMGHSVPGMASVANAKGDQVDCSEPKEASASSTVWDRKVASPRRCRSVGDAWMRATAGSRFSCDQSKLAKRVQFQGSDDGPAMSDIITRPPTQLAPCQSERNVLTTESMAIITRFLERNLIDPKNVNIRLLPGQGHSSQPPAGCSKGLSSNINNGSGDGSAKPVGCGNGKRSASSCGAGPGRGNRSDDDDSNEEDVPLSKLRTMLRIGDRRPRKEAEASVDDPFWHRSSQRRDIRRHAAVRASCFGVERGTPGTSLGKRRKSVESSLRDRCKGPALPRPADSHVECSRRSERPAKIKKSELPIESESLVSVLPDNLMIWPNKDKHHFQPLQHDLSCACALCTVALEAKAALDRILDFVCVGTSTDGRGATNAADTRMPIDQADQSWYAKSLGGFSRSRVGLTPNHLSDSCSADIAPQSVASEGLCNASVSLAGVVVIDDGTRDSSTEERPSWRMLTDDELMRFSDGDNATDVSTAPLCAQKSVALYDSIGAQTRSRSRSHSSYLFKSDVANRRFCLGLRKFTSRADRLEVASKALSDDVALIDVAEGHLLQVGPSKNPRDSCSTRNESAVVEFDTGTMQVEGSAAMQNDSSVVLDHSVAICRDSGAVENFLESTRKESDAIRMDSGAVHDQLVAICRDSATAEKDQGDERIGSDVMQVRKSSGERQNCVAVAIRNDSVSASIDPDEVHNGSGDARNGSGSGALSKSSVEPGLHKNVVVRVGDIRGKSFLCPTVNATPSSAGSCETTGTCDDKLLAGHAAALTGQSVPRMMRSSPKPEDLEGRNCHGAHETRPRFWSDPPSESGSLEPALANDFPISVDVARPFLRRGLDAARADSDARPNDLGAAENDSSGILNGPGALQSESDALPNGSDAFQIESSSLPHGPGAMGSNADAVQVVSDANPIGLGTEQSESGIKPNSLDALHEGPGTARNVSSAAPMGQNEMQNCPGTIRNGSGPVKCGSGVARKSCGEPDRYGNVFVVLGDIRGDNFQRASNRDFSRTTGAPPHGLPGKSAKNFDQHSGSPVTRSGQSVPRMMRSPPLLEDVVPQNCEGARKMRPRILSGPPSESGSEPELVYNRRLRRCKSQETSRRSSARFAS